MTTPKPRISTLGAPTLLTSPTLQAPEHAALRMGRNWHGRPGGSRTRRGTAPGALPGSRMAHRTAFWGTPKPQSPETKNPWKPYTLS